MKLSDRITNWFSALSHREQRLLGMLGSVLLVFVVFVFGYTVYTSLAEIEARIARAEELSAIIDANKEGLTEKFAGKAQKPDRDPVPKLTTFLEDISKRKEVPVQNYGGEKSVPTKDKRYTETSMDVRLARVTLKQLVDFLQEIESAEEAAYTKQLEVNLPRKDQRDSFDVNFVVATYEDPNAPKKADKPKEPNASKDPEESIKTKEPNPKDPNPYPTSGEEGERPTKQPANTAFGGARGSGSGSTGDGTEPSYGVPAPSKNTIRPIPDKAMLPTSRGVFGKRPVIPTPKKEIPQNNEENKEGN